MPRRRRRRRRVDRDPDAANVSTDYLIARGHRRDHAVRPRRPSSSRSSPATPAQRRSTDRASARTMTSCVGAEPRMPWYFVVPGSVAVAFLALPVAGLLGAGAVGRPAGAAHVGGAVLVALRLSLVTSLLATLVAVVLGIPLAWLMARSRAFGRHVGAGARHAPARPSAGGRRRRPAHGLRPSRACRAVALRRFGMQIPFTTAAVVIAEAFVAMPFLVITVEGALRSSDRRLEQAAATLGASRWTVFRRVTLPLVAPSIVAGAVLCWARALGEFGATLTFAGSFPGVTRTMPLAVYAALDVDRSRGDRPQRRPPARVRGDPGLTARPVPAGAAAMTGLQASITSRHDDVRPRRRPRRRAGADHRDPRPERVGEDDAAQRPRRTAAHRPRSDRHR